MRGLLGRAAAAVLGGELANLRIRARRPQESLVLAFHNVIPDNERIHGDSSLHLTLSCFTEIVERVLALCEPVRLVAIPDSRERPAFAVTFDDAYLGAMALAIPVLCRMGVPATVFVSTGLVGGRDLWWDVLSDQHGNLNPGIRRYALETLQGDDDRIRRWAQASGVSFHEVPALWRTASLSLLRETGNVPGVEYALHSSSHRAMDRLTPAEMWDELVKPIQWFEANKIAYRRLLAYPYGRSSQLVRRTVASAGYEGAWKVTGGWGGHSRIDLLGQPRLNVPAGKDVRHVMLRVAGFVTR